jgi:hypothetical protein
MPEPDGLPGGPVLQPNLNLNVPQTQGVTRGMVSSGVASMLNSAAGGTDMNVYNAVGKSSGGAPGFPSFQGGGPDPLAHIPSTLEAAVGSANSPEAAILKAVMTGLTRPVATISDGLSRLLPWVGAGGRLNRIDDLQQNFFQNHAGDLANLSDSMNSALKNIRNLGYLMQPDSIDKFHLSAGPLQQILEQKKQVGRDLSDQLADAIANTDDPDEKAQLQTEKDQVDAWMANCDQRIAQDQSAITDLQQRTNAVMRVANTQSQALVNAAFSPSPGNVTSDGQIVSTTHTQPDAVQYAAGLRQSLIQSRVQMNSAMAGR